MKQQTILERLTLITSFKVDDKGTKKAHVIKALDEKNTSILVYIPANTVYAHIDRQLKAKHSWKFSPFIDLDTNRRIHALYLDDIKLPRKKQFVMKGFTRGIIIMINGSEPGQCTIPLHNYSVKEGDMIEIVYKHELMAR
ncbi:MAG: hypothetical protein AABY01_03655 [Nanoarchaeota archaeon]